jgi:hypothetical protein
MNSLILNEKNIVNATNNSKLMYDFRGEASLINSSIALNSIHLYHSWYNINKTRYNNNTFSYKWFDVSGNLDPIFDVTIKDGHYTVNTLNEYLQSILVSRGHYLVDTETGKYIYYLELQTNSTYYAIQLNVYPMITEAMATNYQRGSTSWGYPSAATTPQFIVNSSNFKNLIGFNEGVYPEIAYSTIQTFLSTSAPRMSPVSSIFVKCSLCYNKYSDPDNIIHSFTSGDVAFGDLIKVEPMIETFVKIRDQSTYSFTIEFLDQDLKQIDILDSQMVVVLSLMQDNNKI